MSQSIREGVADSLASIPSTPVGDELARTLFLSAPLIRGVSTQNAGGLDQRNVHVFTLGALLEWDESLDHVRVETETRWHGWRADDGEESPA